MSTESRANRPPMRCYSKTCLLVCFRDGLYITYFSGLLSLSEPVTGFSWEGNTATFEAFLSFSANVIEGVMGAAGVYSTMLVAEPKLC